MSSIVRRTAAPTPRARQLSAKALPAQLAATALSLNHASSVVDLAIGVHAEELMAMGFRRIIVSELTGVSLATLKAMLDRMGSSPPTGGPPADNPGRRIMRKPHTHLAGTLFVDHYARLRSREITQRGRMTATALARAGQLTWQALGEAGPKLLSAMDMTLLANLWEEDRIVLSRCRKCALHFMATREPVLIAANYGTGSCPHCRLPKPKDPVDEKAPSLTSSIVKRFYERVQKLPVREGIAVT